MSSNQLYGLRKVGTFVQLTGLPSRPVRQPVFAGCTRRLCDRRLWLVTKSALEVYVVHDDALYKLTTFTFTFNDVITTVSTTAMETRRGGIKSCSATVQFNSCVKNCSSSSSTIHGSGISSIDTLYSRSITITRQAGQIHRQLFTFSVVCLLVQRRMQRRTDKDAKVVRLCSL